jgi:hypothetical protein
MKNLNDDWRNFMRHFGIYAVVMTALATLNWLTGLGSLWVQFPAAAWGGAVLIHLVVAMTESVHPPWKDLARHSGIYMAVIGMLAIFNMSTSSALWVHWPALAWGVAVGIHLVSTLTERNALSAMAHNDAVEAADTEIAVETDTEISLHDEALQTKLERALAYQQQIRHFVATATDKAAPRRLQTIAGQVDIWVASVQDLAQRLDTFQQNALIRQDVETVPATITQLQQQLAETRDPTLTATLERTLTNYQNQLNTLQNLQHLMRRAEIQMDSTLASLGTIYSQLLTNQSTNQVADYAHLSAEAEEETRLLQDHLEALTEIKLGSP